MYHISRAGIEPATIRTTAECSTTELSRVTFWCIAEIGFDPMTPWL